MVYKSYIFKFIKGARCNFFFAVYMLPLLPLQACGHFVYVVECCWTVDFFMKNSGRIFCNSPKTVTYSTFLRASPH